METPTDSEKLISGSYQFLNTPRPFGLHTIKITVDGKTITAEDGEWLVDSIRREAHDIPHVCYHPQMGPIQTCDTCMVEVDGYLVRACATRAAAGQTVATESKRAQAAQKEAFDRLLGNHMLYCTVCDNNNGNCEVHNTTAFLKIEHQQHPYKPKPYDCDFTNPFYRYDPDQCILCGRCVEACQTVQVNETLSIDWEATVPRVVWDGGHTIGGSSCVSCGHCITVCPCNALMEKSMLGEAGYMTMWPKQSLDKLIDVVKDVEPEMGYGPILQVSETEAAMRLANRIQKTKTVCTYCGVGCSFEIWTKDRHILKVEPAEGAANGISTCVKGKFGWDYVNHPDRLQKPLIREGDDFREATWDEALTLVARRLREIKAANGPDSIGVIASSKCTNEDSYLMQKFARAVIGTNNTDNCSRYCQSPATAGLWRTVGYGGDSGSIADIEKAELVIIVGSNTAESHPVLATRVKRAHKLRGQKLIVADLRENEMARRADLYFSPAPSTDIIWLSAVAKYLLDNGLARTEFLTTWVNGLEAYKKSLEPFTMEFAAERCQLPIETLKQVAHAIAESSATCILWAMGITQHCSGSDNSTAISNLLLVSGNYMRPGTGAYPLRGHNNVQGTSDMGAMPPYFPGYDKVADDAVRARYEEAWGVKLSTTKGLDNHEMVDKAIEGSLKAIYLAGEDMVSADSDANRVGRAFSALEFFVVQDIFFTETCRYADVVFPAAPALEKDGTFVSTERRIQRLYKVWEPLGQSRADWQITQDLANRMGAGWNYLHPADVMHEVASLSPMFAGVTYDRLAGFKTLQWPVAIDGTDQPILYTKNFHFDDGKARLHPLEWQEPCEKQDEEYDIHLNNGRLLEHFHEGNMTYRVKGIKEENPERWIEISPEMAKERGIHNGTWLDVTSRVGTIRVKALVTDRVHGQQVYLPLNSSEGPVNVLTSSNVDRDVHTPAYKETAVHIQVLPFAGDNPLRPVNFRYSGHPTPQRGVEVERKWERTDYRLPGEPPLVQIGVASSRSNGNGHRR